MSSRNDETTAYAIVAAFILTTVLLMIVVVYAIAVILAAIATVQALLAWNKPRIFFGEILAPDEARYFVGAGVASAVILPSFVAICSTLLNYTVPDELWIHFALGGYAFGSFGLTLYAGKDEYELVTIDPSKESKLSAIDLSFLDVPPDEQSQPEPSPPVFRYASWDDEEAGR